MYFIMQQQSEILCVQFEVEHLRDEGVLLSFPNNMIKLFYNGRDSEKMTAAAVPLLLQKVLYKFSILMSWLITIKFYLHFVIRITRVIFLR